MHGVCVCHTHFVIVCLHFRNQPHDKSLAQNLLSFCMTSNSNDSSCSNQSYWEWVLQIFGALRAAIEALLISAPIYTYIKKKKTSLMIYHNVNLKLPKSWKFCCRKKYCLTTDYTQSIPWEICLVFGIRVHIYIYRYRFLKQTANIA